MPPVTLATQPNERRCATMHETHVLALPECCPFSKNPLPGSEVRISYDPLDFVLEVQSLRDYIDSYRGGLRDAEGQIFIRSMEGMIQNIAQDAANAVQAHVKVKAKLRIAPDQKMVLVCYANPVR